MLRNSKVWLASSYTGATKDGADFSVWLLQNDNSRSVCSANLYYSNGENKYSYCGIRPVVKLSSNVNIYKISNGIFGLMLDDVYN